MLTGMMDLLRQKRMVQIFYLFSLLFLLIIARLANVQLNYGAEYAYKALQQRTTQVVLETIPRGDILDRNLKSLTGSRLQQRVIIFPSLVVQPLVVKQALAAILGVETQAIAKQFTRGNTILPNILYSEQINQIQMQDWQGVMVLPVRCRYGQNPLAVHLVGHLGKISSWQMKAALTNVSGKPYQLNDLVGKTGLEKYYEHQLKATQPQRLVRAFTDATGSLLVGIGFETVLDIKDSGRQHLVTTIDYQTQQIVERVLDKHIRRGAVVVMDVRTGEIVALASRPDFHPAEIPGILETAPADTFVNHAISLQKPGSLFKVLVAAAAIEEGIATPNSIFTCQGKSSRLVPCWYSPGHGKITLKRAFAESCNPAFAQLGLKLGAENIIAYAGKFGLANQSITGYPYRADPRQDWQQVGELHNLVNSSIGQGPVLTTPVQLTAMLNTIANNGKYVQPRVIKARHNSDGEVIKHHQIDAGYQVISVDTALQMQKLLSLAVYDGVGHQAMVANHGSAGKTGSAEIDGQAGVSAWFSGYAPLDNPRYVTTVLVIQGESGGKTAAPVFREIMEQILE